MANCNRYRQRQYSPISDKSVVFVCFTARISYAGFFRAFVEQFFKEIVLARWVYDGREKVLCGKGWS